MRGFPRRVETALICVHLVWAFSLSATARAQDQPSYFLEVRRQAAERLLLSVGSLEVRSTVSAAERGAQELASRLVEDLVYSGLFALQDPLPEGVRLPRHAPPGSLVQRKEVSASLRLSLEGIRAEQMVWVGRVVEERQGRQLLGKRYVVDLARPARQIHHFADEIVRELTGEQGIAQTRVLFSRAVGEGREIFLVDYDGRGLRQITRNGSLNLLPRWSPNGERLCYTSYWEGRQRLLVLDGETGVSTNVAEFEGLNFGAAWSPAGDEIAVTLSRDGNPEIYRILSDGTVRQRLSFEPSIECSPNFDPQGRQLAFTSDRTGVPQIYVMDREGANRRRLTYEGRYNDSAAWSPRGDRIAYVSRREGRFQIFLIEPDGSNLQLLTTESDGNNEDPSWAPDGRHLVVSSDRSGRRQLWILDVDGGTARPLTEGADDSGPHWSGPPRAAP